jgi:integrase
MPKRGAGLTARLVETKKKPGLFADGGNLYLQVTGDGANHVAKSWVYRYQLGGRRRDMGLGSVENYTLAEAREKVREARRLVAEGIDPIEKRRAERAAQAIADAKAMTFKDCAEAYIQAHQAGWRSVRHAAQWSTTLRDYAYPVFGSLPVASIDVGLVMKAIEPIWTMKAETASRLRGRIEAVLDWAKTRGYRAGENPARWKGHLENLLPKKAKVAPVVHHAALAYAKITTFVAGLRQQESVAARVLEFAILTATRSGKARAVRWDEIDLKASLWTIPGARTKAGKEHRVPLSDAAMAIVEAMAAIKSCDFVFAGMKPNTCVAERTIPALLERMGRRDLTAHGFRSTFSDWAAEQTSFPSEVREMALAHTVGNKVEAAYRRGDLFDKRRQIMDAWARFVNGTEAEVVELDGARRSALA